MLDLPIPFAGRRYCISNYMGVSVFEGASFLALMRKLRVFRCHFGVPSKHTHTHTHIRYQHYFNHRLSIYHTASARIKGLQKNGSVTRLETAKGCHTPPPPTPTPSKTPRPGTRPPPPPFPPNALSASQQRRPGPASRPCTRAGVTPAIFLEFSLRGEKKNRRRVEATSDSV